MKVFKESIIATIAALLVLVLTGATSFALIGATVPVGYIIFFMTFAVLSLLLLIVSVNIGINALREARQVPATI